MFAVSSDRFVFQSNEKLELTEQLDAEKHRAQQLENELRRAETAPTTEPPVPRTDVGDSQAIAQWAERYHTLEKQHSSCQETIEKLQSKIVSFESIPSEVRLFPSHT